MSLITLILKILPVCSVSFLRLDTITITDEYGFSKVIVVSTSIFLTTEETEVGLIFRAIFALFFIKANLFNLIKKINLIK
jgi:hypothetical protein